MYKWTCIVQMCAVQGSTILFVRYEMEGCKDVCDFVIKTTRKHPLPAFIFLRIKNF